MITQLGGRPGMFGGDADNKWTWRQILGIVVLFVVIGVAVYFVLSALGLLERFLGAPNTYNHIDWAGNGIQSAAFSLLRPWDKPPRDDMVYGIDEAEKARRAKVMKTSLSS